MNRPLYETNPVEREVLARFRAKRTNLRSYANEQGPPFRYPQTGERRRPLDPFRFWKALFLIVAFYGVMTGVLVMAFHWLGGAL